MTKKSSTTLKRAGVLIALFALVLIVPQPAAAQDVPAGCDTTAVSTLSLTGDTSDAITPISGAQELTVGFTYTAPAAAYSLTPVPIEFSVSGEPGWANVVISERIVFVPIAENEATEVSESIGLTVSVDANAPAFEKAKFEVQADAKQGTCVTASQATADMEITPGFLERWSSRFDQSILQFGQNTAFQIPVTVENQGNGAIEVQFQQIERDESKVDGRALDVVVPPGFSEIGSEAQGGEKTRTFNVDVQTPFRNGYMNERFPLAVEISGTSADQQGIELRPATLRAVVQTQGVFVPGFEMIPMLVALVGVAMIQMRRRSG